MGDLLQGSRVPSTREHNMMQKHPACGVLSAPRLLLMLAALLASAAAQGDGAQMSAPHSDFQADDVIDVFQEDTTPEVVLAEFSVPAVLSGCPRQCKRPICMGFEKLVLVKAAGVHGACCPVYKCVRVAGKDTEDGECDDGWPTVKQLRRMTAQQLQKLLRRK